MALYDDTQTALASMIISHSGWRGVFAVSGGEEDKTGESSAAEIGEAHRVIVAAAATAFAEYLYSRTNGNKKPLVLTGCDTRPTGKAIAEKVIPALLAAGCRVRHAGIAAAPEIMAWARSLGRARGPRRADAVTGFMYISASHNPIGHNGLKFGLADGGVLPAEEAARLAVIFRSLIKGIKDRGSGIRDQGSGIRDQGSENKEKMADNNSVHCSLFTVHFSNPYSPINKKRAYKAYFKFSGEVAWGNNVNIVKVLKQGIAKRPIGVCCDFNGSARCVSIDRDFLRGQGIQFEAINAVPGEIAHRIVPEGESLEPCRLFLEELHSRDSAFILGYVPDCDGDRGNLVIWDESLQKARALEAQEVFALACIAELAHLVWTNDKSLDDKSLSGKPSTKTAIAVNDPTSFRVDRIAEAFGAKVFRAEVGEANVVNLARKLREEGYTVRILGEGSNGGNITHPSAVRDPLHTVLALAKLVSIRGEGGKPGHKSGLFEIWRNASGRPYNPDFCLADVIASLPPFITTSAYAPEAALTVTSADHGELKRRYQKIFLRQWEEKKGELSRRLGIHRWEACAYNGINERRGLDDFGEAGKGGLKICFYNADDKPAASIWMRGSATEPVFRVMADVEGTDRQLERSLIEWQRGMTIEADRS